MKKTITVLLMMVLPVLGFAAGPTVPLDKANIDLSDTESLQRGAKLFADYCVNCHSANFMRFNRVGQDLGISEADIKSMMYTTDKVGDPMNAAMDPRAAKQWFGTLPPDLTVIERFRGEDWLYTYFRSFYQDDSRPFGMNNTVFKDVGMPHVMADLQGVAQPVYGTKPGQEGQVVVGIAEAKGGALSAEEYDMAVRDLVGFMVYMGEPAKLVRYDLGVKVIIFLIILSILLYLVKKEYWRDVK